MAASPPPMASARASVGLPFAMRPAASTPWPLREHREEEERYQRYARKSLIVQHRWNCVGANAKGCYAFIGLTKV
jgi:hypothetical protein